MHVLGNFVCQEMCDSSLSVVFHLSLKMADVSSASHFHWATLLLLIQGMLNDGSPFFCPEWSTLGCDQCVPHAWGTLLCCVSECLMSTCLWSVCNSWRKQCKPCCPRQIFTSWGNAWWLVAAWLASLLCVLLLMCTTWATRLGLFFYFVRKCWWL